MDGFMIGSRGWDFDAWQEGFFPDDLPHEWRLSYYANEFPAVLLPWRDWGAVAPEQLALWREEVHARFRFYLEYRHSVGASDSEAVRRRLLALGDRIGGLLLAPDIDPAAVRQLIGGWTTPPPCYLPVDCETGFGVDLPANCWESQAGRVLLIETGSCGDLRQLRRLVERLIQTGSTGAGQRGLFFTGEPPGMPRMQEARTLLQLMGLA